MIAISYRREDSLPVAGRLYDRLQQEFGRENVFMDFDSIPYGVDFRDHIKQMIGRAKVLVAIIGPNWMGKRKNRTRRIDEAGDFVRIEIAYALERKLPIIPILFSNTQMPRSEELPADIEAFAFRNGLSLDVGIDFHHHAERLTAAITRLLSSATPLPHDLTETPSAEATPAQEVSPPRTESHAASRTSPLSTSKEGSTIESPSVDPARSERKSGAKHFAEQPVARPVLPRRPPVIRTKIRKVGEIAGRLTTAVAAKLTAFKAAARRSLDSLRTFVTRAIRDSTDRIRRHGTTIGLWGASLIAVLLVAAAIFWGIRSGNFRLLGTQMTEFFKSRPATTTQSSTPIPAVPRETENPVTTTPPASPTPAQNVKGELALNTTPEGDAFEIIDSDNEHHIGKTPDTIENLPIGYAQILFRREGFSDHKETVWISAKTRSLASWNFPETDRLSQPSPPTQNVTRGGVVQNEPTPPNPPIPSPTANPVPETGPSWEIRIGDYVKQFVAVNQLQDANATVAFYAPNADYFGSRGKDHAYILGDIQKYNVQWPARRDSIDGDVHVEEKAPAQQYRATFKLNLYAENPKSAEWSNGEVAMTLDMDIINGVPKIVAIDQKRLRRQSGRGKGPRPADMEPVGPIKPVKLTRVSVKKYGFSALVPTEIFPNAEAKLGDGVTDRLTSGCAAMTFSAPHENVRKVYDDYVNQFHTAPDHRTIDYKVVKDTWFAVSGSSRTTGYYVKGVRHDNDVFVMELDYVGAVCRIPASMVAEMSHAFDGKLDAGAAPSTSGSDVVQPPAIEGSPSASPNDAGAQKLTKVYVKKYGVSALLPADVFPEAKKLSDSDQSFLQGTSWTGQTTLTFSSVREPLAKVYAECATEHSPQAPSKTVGYKILKPTWFVVSGDLGPDADASLGFYTKGVKKGSSVVIMHLQWREDDFPLSQETFTAMSRGFDGN